MLVGAQTCCARLLIFLNGKMIAMTSETNPDGGNDFDGVSIFAKKGDVISFSLTGRHPVSENAYWAHLTLIPLR